MFAFKNVALLGVLAAGAGSAFAQVSLSSQCQTTLSQIVLSSSAECLNAQALIAVATASSSTSLVGPINNWLTGLCAQPACSNDTLSSIISNLTSGCPTEVQSLGLGNVSSQEITTIVQMAYPTVRKVACLTDISQNNGLCVTETLYNVQNQTGTLSMSSVQSMVSQISQGSSLNVTSNAICTDCTKQAYNIIKADFSDLVSSGVTNSISSECGASFIDGSAPSAISQSATTATASSKNTVSGAMSFVAGTMGVIVSSLIAIASAFTFFV